MILKRQSLISDHSAFIFQKGIYRENSKSSYIFNIFTLGLDSKLITAFGNREDGTEVHTLGLLGKNGMASIIKHRHSTHTHTHRHPLIYLRNIWGGLFLKS